MGIKYTVIADFSWVFIAFAAGTELYLKELRSQYKSIAWNTFGQLIITFLLGSLTVFFMGEMIPFMREMNFSSRIVVAILAVTIFVTHSPASAIAVIHEMRAKE